MSTVRYWRLRAFDGVIHAGALCFHTDPPRLKITLGRNLDVSNINEGSDVYFECHIKASPTIIRLDWDHNVSAKTAYTVVIRVFGWRSVGTENSAPTTVSAKTIIVSVVHFVRRAQTSGCTRVEKRSWAIRRWSYSRYCAEVREVTVVLRPTFGEKRKVTPIILTSNVSMRLGVFEMNFVLKFECRSRRLKSNKILPSVHGELDDWDLLMRGRSCWVEAWDEGSRFQIVGNEGDWVDEDDLKKRRLLTSYRVKYFGYFYFSFYTHIFDYIYLSFLILTRVF